VAGGSGDEEVLALFRDSQSRDHTVSIFHSSQPIFADSWQLTAAVEKTKKRKNLLRT